MIAGGNILPEAKETCQIPDICHLHFSLRTGSIAHSRTTKHTNEGDALELTIAPGTAGSLA